jgi:hypothetical protein
MTTGATIDPEARFGERAEMRQADDPIARAVAVLQDHFGQLEEVPDPIG